MDTSALIHLSVQYPVDVFPSLWADLERLTLIAPREVLRELRPKDDALCNWAKSNKRIMFVSLTKEQVQLAKDIVQGFPRLIDPDKTIADADPFVIALARTDGYTVVTAEKGESGRKIPGVCKHYGVQCLSSGSAMVEFFRQENFKY